MRNLELVVLEAISWLIENGSFSLSTLLSLTCWLLLCDGKMATEATKKTSSNHSRPGRKDKAKDTRAFLCIAYAFLGEEHLSQKHSVASSDRLLSKTGSHVLFSVTGNEAWDCHITKQKEVHFTRKKRIMLVPN